jgi:hypothetical protein
LGLSVRAAGGVKTGWQSPHSEILFFAAANSPASPALRILHADARDALPDTACVVHAAHDPAKFDPRAVMTEAGGACGGVT